VCASRASSSDPTWTAGPSHHSDRVNRCFSGPLSQPWSLAAGATGVADGCRARSAAAGRDASDAGLCAPSRKSRRAHRDCSRERLPRGRCHPRPRVTASRPCWLDGRPRRKIDAPGGCLSTAWTTIPPPGAVHLGNQKRADRQHAWTHLTFREIGRRLFVSRNSASPHAVTRDDGRPARRVVQVSQPTFVPRRR